MHEALWCGTIAIPTACKVTQPLLRRTTASDPAQFVCDRKCHRRKKPLTAKPSCKDEARVGQKGTHAYIWAPIGSRPLMVRDNRHDSAYLYGAICPARGVGAAVIMPAANTEGMNELLKELSSQVTPGAHAAVICDQAGWHQPGDKLKVPDNMTLVPLPPYSPELNSMENVWEYLRGNKLCSLVWDTYEAIVEACKDAWNFLIDDPDRICSIGARGWACVSG